MNKLAKFVNKLIESGKSRQQILNALEGTLVPVCVREEWANEPHRRAALDARRKAKKYYSLSYRGPMKRKGQKGLWLLYPTSGWVKSK